MESLYRGHTYKLAHIDGSGHTILQFVQREPHHHPQEGVLNQEVLRALIDRVQVLNVEKPWHGNATILWHLRSALLLHEFRAMERDLEDERLKPELVHVDNRGHFVLERD